MYFFVNSFKWKAIFSSVVLSNGRRRFCVYCQRSLYRSAFALNFAMSLIRTLTLGTPYSLITVFVGEVRTTVLPGVNVSRKPLRSCLDLFVTSLGNLSSREFSVRGIDFHSFTWSMKRDTDLFFLPLYPWLESIWVFFMTSSMSLSLLSTVTQPLSSR